MNSLGKVRFHICNDGIKPWPEAACQCVGKNDFDPVARIAELEAERDELRIRGTQVIHAVDATNHGAVWNAALDAVLDLPQMRGSIEQLGGWVIKVSLIESLRKGEDNGNNND